MLYIAYLDEFGHIGPYISHDHPRHKTHPAFGLAGVVLPADKVRNFATFFFQMKNRLLDFEIKKSGEHPAKWEKKGSALYTTENVLKYKELRQGTFRILNKIKKCGGFVFYVGLEKRRSEDGHSSKLYQSVLQEAIKRLDQEFTGSHDEFFMIMDEQEDLFRQKIVEAAAIKMFAGNEPCRTLIEPPIHAESHLYQTLQCADWICGLIGRYASFELGIGDEYAEYKWFDTYFRERINAVSRRSSIRKN